MQKSSIVCISNIGISIAPVVKGIDILPPLFQCFSLADLERLKSNGEWLTDSHITFSLLFVHRLFPHQSLKTFSCVFRDCYQNLVKKNIWGDLKIKLLDTIFWTKLSDDPNRYNEKFRGKMNLLEYDYVVMPMFGG